MKMRGGIHRRDTREPASCLGGRTTRFGFSGPGSHSRAELPMVHVTAGAQVRAAFPNSSELGGRRFGELIGFARSTHPVKYPRSRRAAQYDRGPSAGKRAYGVTRAWRRNNGRNRPVLDRFARRLRQADRLISARRPRRRRRCRRRRNLTRPQLCSRSCARSAGIQGMAIRRSPCRPTGWYPRPRVR